MTRLIPVLVTALALAGCASFSGIAPSACMQPPEKLGVATAAAPVALADAWWGDFADRQLST